MWGSSNGKAEEIRLGTIFPLLRLSLLLQPQSSVSQGDIAAMEKPKIDPSSYVKGME
jgi:hypothetical protein